MSEIKKEDIKIENYAGILLIERDFKSKCIDILNEICKDNKIDLIDVPYITTLITLIYCEQSKIKIKKIDLPAVLKLVLLKLFEELNITIKEEEKKMLNILIETSMTIVFLNVNDYINKCTNKSCGKNFVTKCENLIDVIKKNIINKTNS